MKAKDLEENPPSSVLLDHMLDGALCSNKGAEAAATIIVRALQRKGDKWAPFSLEDITSTVRAECAAGSPMGIAAASARLDPDFDGLVIGGHAVWMRIGGQRMMALSPRSIGMIVAEYGRAGRRRGL